MKANRFKPVLETVRREGDIGIDACSPGEVALAREVGFDPDEISVTSVMPSNRDLAVYAGDGYPREPGHLFGPGALGRDAWTRAARRSANPSQCRPDMATIRDSPTGAASSVSHRRRRPTRPASRRTHRNTSSMSTSAACGQRRRAVPSETCTGGLRHSRRCCRACGSSTSRWALLAAAAGGAPTLARYLVGLAEGVSCAARKDNCV